MIHPKAPKAPESHKKNVGGGEAGPMPGKAAARARGDAPAAASTRKGEASLSTKRTVFACAGAGAGVKRGWEAPVPGWGVSSAQPNPRSWRVAHRARGCSEWRQSNPDPPPLFPQTGRARRPTWGERERRRRSDSASKGPFFSLSLAGGWGRGAKALSLPAGDGSIGYCIEDDCSKLR